MSLTRREFIKICSASVAGLGVSQILHPAVAGAISGSLGGSRPPVLWIKGLACGSCTSALLDSSHPTIADLMFKVMSLEFHPALMAAEGASALDHMFGVAKEYKGRFILALEGAVPLAAGGRYAVAGETGGREWTVRELVADLAPKAAVTMAVGTCASYGGMAAAKGGTAEAVGLGDFMRAEKIKTPLVNVPGCSPHPDWIVGSLASTIDLFSRQSGRRAAEELAASLDPYQRPLDFYAASVHEGCPHLPEYKNRRMSASLASVTGCRHSLGCRGPRTMADCATRRWNGGVNWCVENAVCTGCVEPGFPDAMSPFYKA